MKQYKHKQSGVYVELIGEVYKPIVKPIVNTETIPRWVVENSNDWEGIKEPLFTTDDDVDIYNDKQEIYAINVSSWGSATITLERRDIDAMRRWSWRYFSTKEARLEFIVQNKAVLSFNELQQTMKFYQNSSNYNAIRKVTIEKLKQNDSNL